MNPTSPNHRHCHPPLVPGAPGKGVPGKLVPMIQANGSGDSLALFEFLIDFASLFLAQANSQISAVATNKGQWRVPQDHHLALGRKIAKSLFPEVARYEPGAFAARTGQCW
jgi:hypothetical protein